MNGVQPKNNFYQKYIVALTFAFVLQLCFLIHSARAAVVYVVPEKKNAAVGDTVMAEVHINTQGETVNVVDGTVALNTGAGNIEIVEVSTAGSVLSVWSRTPSVENNGKSVTFIGGTPGGFDATSGLLFKIYFKINKIGTVTFTPSDVKAYKNDGKGSLVSVAMSPAVFTLTGHPPGLKLTNEWQKVVSGDNLPPEFLAATVGQDAALFDNKLFLSIAASDYQSGIDYFEIKEGNLPIVRSGNEYVLHDQSLGSEVTVYAYDKAGNVRSLIIKPNMTQGAFTMRLVLLSCIVLLVLGSALLVIIKHKKSSA